MSGQISTPGQRNLRPMCRFCRSERLTRNGRTFERSGLAAVSVVCGDCRREWVSTAQAVVAALAPEALKVGA